MKIYVQLDRKVLFFSPAFGNLPSFAYKISCSYIASSVTN